MSEISIYKSINNGKGGSIDTTSNSTIFDMNEDLRYCCLYVKNETTGNKILQNISTLGVDDVLLGIVSNEQGILLNTLVEYDSNQTVTYLNVLELSNFVLPSLSFITVWLKVDTSNNKHKASKSVNIILEYLDEY